MSNKVNNIFLSKSFSIIFLLWSLASMLRVLIAPFSNGQTHIIFKSTIAFGAIDLHKIILSIVAYTFIAVFIFAITYAYSIFCTEE